MMKVKICSSIWKLMWLCLEEMNWWHRFYFSAGWHEKTYLASLWLFILLDQNLWETDDCSPSSPTILWQFLFSQACNLRKYKIFSNFRNTNLVKITLIMISIYMELCKCFFTIFISINTHNKVMRWVIVSPFYKWGNLCLKKVTEDQKANRIQNWMSPSKAAI